MLAAPTLFARMGERRSSHVAKKAMSEVTDTATSKRKEMIASVQTIETLGQEWVRPSAIWWGDNARPYTGSVAIETSHGWVLLAKVERVIETGEIRRVLIKPEELHVV